MRKTIKQLREEAGLTQLQLAYRLGVTPGAVSLWERAASEPKALQLRALADVFGVSMDVIDLEPFQESKSAA